MKLHTTPAHPYLPPPRGLEFRRFWEIPIFLSNFFGFLFACQDFFFLIVKIFWMMLRVRHYFNSGCFELIIIDLELKKTVFQFRTFIIVHFRIRVS